MIDDGTVSRLDKNHFRITAADPSLRWFQDVGYGLSTQVVNVSQDLAALALQGPNSQAILQEVVTGVNLSKLKYFYLAEGKIANLPVTITRTGYTGDLGYELWIRSEDAEQVWDCLFDRGQRYGLLPVGIVALDIARIEAGLLMIEVDYISSHKALIESQKSSPYEIGLGWAVKLNGANFVGRRALAVEKAQGSQWTFVGIQADWDSMEALYESFDLAPQIAGRASRRAVPIYKDGEQIGKVTSHTFSPMVKEYVGLGTVLSPYAHLGETVDMEVTVAYNRRHVDAKIVKTPFFNPARKR